MKILFVLIFGAALFAAEPAAKEPAAPVITDKQRADFFFAQWKLAQGKLDQIAREMEAEKATAALLQACPNVQRTQNGDIACPPPAEAPRTEAPKK
jgi:hypothetical protein